MPKLSFIIPFYRKKAEVFRKCLLSLFSQSLKDFEVIVVMDGHDDIASDILDEFRRKHRNLIVTTIDHSGAPWARNVGFGASSGEYVCFWDADCYIEPHAAKMWVDTLDKSPDIGFVYADYKFSNEMGAIHGEQFDPWLLRVRNYISACFPVRRSLAAGWNESLESLQDWDFWLSVVEKGGVGKYQNGYAFTTEFPDSGSISGGGCSPDKWLGRVNAVKVLHGLPDRETCVSSPGNKADGIRLAKLIDADYQDYPNQKPHGYKKIVQLGFDMAPGRVELHAETFNRRETRNFLFWTSDNVSQVWSQVSLDAIDKYSILLNSCSTQFVEDATSEKMMKRAGFRVSVLPVPFAVTGDISPLPEKPKFAVDLSPQYGQLMTLLEMSLPDIELELLSGAHKMDDYTGMIYLYNDRTMSQGIKRMALAGRHVISNVKAPFAGYTSEKAGAEKFLEEMVGKIRAAAKRGPNLAASEYYKTELRRDRLMELMNA